GVHRTAVLVADKLRSHGVDEVATGIGRTAGGAIIHGRTNLSGKAIGLRADMDALTSTDESGAPHASTIPGKLHACGPGRATAMLLGAATYLAETRKFDGRVALIFQPAEEGGGGGKVMLDDGLIEKFDISEFYGMHNWPGMPLGHFGIR